MRPLELRLGCRSLRRDVITKCAVYRLRCGKQLVKVWLDKHDVRAFAVGLRVLPSLPGSNQFLRILVAQGVLVIAHRLCAHVASLCERRSTGCDRRAL